MREERDRYAVLLADALVLACSLAADAGYTTEPGALLELLGAARGMRLERPAWIEAVEEKARRLNEREPSLRGAPEPELAPRSLKGTPEPELAEAMTF